MVLVPDLTSAMAKELARNEVVHADLGPLTFPDLVDALYVVTAAWLQNAKSSSELAALMHEMLDRVSESTGLNVALQGGETEAGAVASDIGGCFVFRHHVDEEGIFIAFELEPIFGEMETG